MKFCVLIIFLVLPWISRVGDWALRWTEGNEELQVFFVMLFFPVIMNATQYYIIDSFIKNQKPSEHEALAGDDTASIDGARHADPFEDPPSENSEEIDSEDEDLSPKAAAEVKVKPKLVEKRNRGSKDRHSYDPQLDGENSPTVVGSGSSERAKLLGKDTDSEEEVKSGEA